MAAQKQQKTWKQNEAANLWEQNHIRLVAHPSRRRGRHFEV